MLHDQHVRDWEYWDYCKWDTESAIDMKKREGDWQDGLHNHSSYKPERRSLFR